MKLFRFKKEKTEEPVNGEIVIIDDTPENLHLLNDILSQRGYKVRALPNGPMGINACQAASPDLVLLDITMPGMNGYEVAARLKADSKTRDIPIIFISAMTQTEDKVKAFKAGGVDYVTKPLQVEEVIARVETHLSISRMREQVNQANQKLLAWNLGLSGGASGGSGIPEDLAVLFGKMPGELLEGDQVEATLSVLAVHSASDQIVDAIAEGFVKNFSGSLIARFSGIFIGVSKTENEAIGAWLEGAFGTEEANACLGKGEGVARIKRSSEEGSPLRFDFKSAAVLETISALAKETTG